MAKDEDSNWGGVIVIALILIIVGVVFLWDAIRPKEKQLSPFGDSATVENAATLIYRNYYKIKEIDGARARGFSSGMAKSASVLIPAGEHIIIFDYNDTKGVPFIFRWGGKAEDCKVICNLEPGKTYVLKSVQYGTFLEPLFTATSMTTNIEELPEDGLKAYLKEGHKTKESKK
jgi:hypothetical protein